MKYELFIDDEGKQIPLTSFFGATKEITIYQSAKSSTDMFTLTNHVYAKDEQGKIQPLLNLIKSNKHITFYHNKKLIYSGLDMNPQYVLDYIKTL